MTKFLGFGNTIVSISAVVLFLIALGYWPIKNRAYLLNKLRPFTNLQNKVLVDDLELHEFGFSGPKNQLYLVDTLSDSYRQLTIDNSYKRDLVMLYDKNAITFMSSRPHQSTKNNQSYYPYILYLETQNIEPIKMDTKNNIDQK